jgi:hypothetical protein
MRTIPPVSEAVKLDLCAAMCYREETLLFSAITTTTEVMMCGFQMYVQSASKPIACVTHARLFLAAMVMQASKKARLDLRQSDCEGRVTTSFESANIGGIAGMQFEAELDAEEGSTRVTFIIREVDVDEAKALLSSGVPLLELFPYIDLDEAESLAQDDSLRWN